MASALYLHAPWHEAIRDGEMGPWETEQAIDQLGREIDGIEWRVFELEDMDRQDDADEWHELKRSLNLRLADLRLHLDQLDGGWG